jgi:hypothetical protein
MKTDISFVGGLGTALIGSGYGPVGAVVNTAKTSKFRRVGRFSDWSSHYCMYHFKNNMTMVICSLVVAGFLL